VSHADSANHQLEELVEDLVRVEARLRELAYDRLRSAAGDGDSGAETEERRFQKARRAVAKAISELGGQPEGEWA